MRTQKKKDRDSQKQITKKMTFAEILEVSPKISVTLMEKGMHCIGCEMAMYETLEQGALMHGLNPDKLVNELNKKNGKYPMRIKKIKTKKK